MFDEFSADIMLGLSGKSVDWDQQSLMGRRNDICHKYHIAQGVFFHWPSPKKFKYGNLMLGESTLT